MQDFEVRAKSRYVPQSARKVRLVVDHVRGMGALEALGTLKLMPHRAATSLYKLVHSAVANAENNFGMDGQDLFIAEAWVDEGPMRRWRRFGARGRFKPIRKRSSHVTVILRERTPTEF